MKPVSWGGDIYHIYRVTKLTAIYLVQEYYVGTKEEDGHGRPQSY